MDYKDALKYILFRTDYERGPRPPYKERHYRLDRVQELLAAVGDPHLTFDTVHIAGTKGKGSTTAMIASVLSAAGYRTGMYTSPHLHTFRERMRVNGDYISQDLLIALTQELAQVLASRPQVTVFETITALAFMYMAKQQAQIAAIEVGLGGRLDATNVLTPLCSVITSISLDHMGVLGSTLEEIAEEKAGIIKASTPVVSAPQHARVAGVISRRTVELSAPLIQVGRDWSYRIIGRSLAGQIIDVLHDDQVPYKELWIPLVGEHQAENATTAIASLETVRNRYPFEEAALRQGFSSIQWPGRFEVLTDSPLVIVDGAHNPYSCTKLIRTIEDLEPDKKVHLVFGASSGHEPGKLLATLVPQAESVHLVQAHHARAIPLEELKETLEGMNIKTSSTGTVSEGVATALARAGEQDIILVTGSLFVVAEARKYLLETQGSPPEQDPPGIY